MVFSNKTKKINVNLFIFLIKKLCFGYELCTIYMMFLLLFLTALSLVSFEYIFSCFADSNFF